MSASASSSTTSPSIAALAQVPRQPPIFEFMKRKRWADLLVTELSEAILLVLSPACRVLFCGRAVQELLGWKDEELVDGELLELMNGAASPPRARAHAG
ncbi:hypothetical protein EWM64_g10800 [Hericium alpestre]|uniref:PAS domain-containing protein n=1 Tax=Hericium alpestre TaxID=135208 RepID=A0A4Y9ZHB6_9AGAM|nr:hypothetical protein EWM64_g10800 [Hericium alpestre]